jgi:hypothetical protein
MLSQEEAASAADESSGSKPRMSQSQEEAILKELREISDRHYNNKYQGENLIKRPREVVASSLAGNGICQDNSFLRQIDEDRDLNQYWYSEKTIEILCNAIREGLSLFKGKRVAFLSTPSLFFSLSMEEREQCALFEVSCLIFCVCAEFSNDSPVLIHLPPSPV